nr:centrosomal protein of 68 kDa isoform X3 [Rattus norvegicus]
MSLGEDEAETKVSVNTEVPSCGRWDSGNLLSPGQEPEHLEVQGGPQWRAEADPGCISGVFLSQTYTASKEPVAGRSEPPLSGPLPSASVGTGELLHPMGSQTFCCQLEELICWLYNVTDVADLSAPPRASLTGLKSSLQLYRQFKKDIDEHQSLTESVLEKGEILLQCLLDNTPVLKDVLVRIAEQSGELESRADHLYDSILASLDKLAGCTLIPDNKPRAAAEHLHEGP